MNYYASFFLHSLYKISAVILKGKSALSRIFTGIERFRFFLTEYSGTYTLSWDSDFGKTKDMGAKHTYRYISVPAKPTGGIVIPKGNHFVKSGTSDTVIENNTTGRYDFGNTYIFRTADIQSITIFVATYDSSSSAWAQWKLFDGDFSRSINYGVSANRGSSTTLTGWADYEYIMASNGANYLMGDITFK